MKRSKLFFIAFISLSIASISSVNAEVKVTTKKKTPPKVNMSGALGKNLNVDGTPQTAAPGTKNNIFYNATVGKKIVEPPKPTPTPLPTPPPEGGTGMVNRAAVQKNQTKESYISSGMKLLNENNLDGAMSEFRKAQSLSNDKVVQRWIQVIDTKKKIAQVNKTIADMAEKEKLSAASDRRF